MQRLDQLQKNRDLLTQTLRGIERETLRVDSQGNFALTPHPKALGSALTHPQITTDYSESLLEFVTGVHHSVDTLLDELSQIHQFVLQNIADETIWMQSLPCDLPAEQDIPIAEYGHSNSGLLKYVYRRGLAERYGKAMQCIAGIHYNFSLPDELWSKLGFEGQSQQEIQAQGYMALIRNFKRYSWLLMYLFGASPAINHSFAQGKKKELQKLDPKTDYLPYGTSLRMSDLGYTSDAQSDLKTCHNALNTYVAMIHDAVSKPWPAYEKIGTHRDGEWIQLNTNIIQIENEFYDSIRPKRTTGRGERPNTALMEKGIEYIEVRCLDINPFSKLGIDAQECYFLDTFLIYCAIKESPFFDDQGHCVESEKNFNLTVNEGRNPQLLLERNQKEISIKDWGLELIEEMTAVATELDIAYKTQQHSKALQAQKEKILDSSKTPSAQLLKILKEQQLSFEEFNWHNSQSLSNNLKNDPLSQEQQQSLQTKALDSLQAQKDLEASDDISFEEYVHLFETSLIDPRSTNK